MNEYINISKASSSSLVEKAGASTAFNLFVPIKEIAQAKGLKSTRSIRMGINKPESKYISREVKVNGGISYEILFSSLEPELPQKLMKSKRLLSNSNINDISNLVQHAIPLGWQLTTDSFGRNRLTKMENNGTYETIVENYQESINRAMELVELVALKDKYSH